MTPRQHTILRITVREYIRTGEPVGSETLKERARLPVSSATVRAECSALEEEGYLDQLHTSAGRVPTTAGYRYYVDHCVPRSPHPQASAQLTHLERGGPHFVRSGASRGGRVSESLLVRNLAQALARLSKTFAVVALEETETREAGMGNLFRMPEFTKGPSLEDVERVAHVLEDRTDALSTLAENGPAVFINGENPFVTTRSVSMVVGASHLPSGEALVAALIGPLRMPYDRHVRVMEAFRQVFDSQATYGQGESS